MSGYSDGVRVEHAAMHELIENGYFVTRAASSKGFSDLVAIKHGQVLIVNVKKTDPPGPASRARTIRVAACLPGVGVPLVALGPASRVTYRRLTGPGPRDFVAWVPDEIAGAS